MKRKRVKIIYWAFLLSIIVHFTLAPIVRNMRVVDAEKEQPPQVISTDPLRPTPPPPPKPTPKPLVQPKRAPHSTAFRPRLVALTNQGKPGKKSTDDSRAVAPGTDVGDMPPGVDKGAASPGPPAPTPTPTQTPKPTCSAPYVEATTRDKFVPETPALALEQGLAGSVKVKVDLSAGGVVTDAKVFESSGSSILDAAAVEAAKRTTYIPKTVDCEHVPGSYLFRVTFENN
ncbi:MAG: energy transducer TonB [Candidatus Eremiobacteraeota bacterium]|nr:energy transducer TonB [Candidatus Eremiobacteraeota bacterium]